MKERAHFYFLCLICVLYSTSKWIRSWLARKRSAQKKALGILAIKTELGDPVVPTSALATVDVRLDHQPLTPAKRLPENVSVFASTTVSNQIANSKKTPLSPSKRYAPYASQVNKVLPVKSAATSSQIYFYRPESPTPSTPLDVPTTYKSVALVDLRNKGSRHSLTPGTTSIPSPFAYSPSNKHALPASAMRPVFDTAFNLDSSPFFNPTQSQIQEPSPFYPGTRSLINVSTYIYNVIHDEEQSHFLAWREIATPRTPPLDSSMDMHLDSLPSSLVLNHFREDAADVYHYANSLEAAVPPIPGGSMPVGPESSFRRLGQYDHSFSDSQSTRFDSSPILTSSLPTTRSNQTNEFASDLAPSTLHHLTRMVDKPINDCNEDVIHLALHLLAEEEDAFRAAMMLVTLSKAGFEWEY